MKRILVTATTVLLAVLLFAAPVLAYSGVTGTVIDSLTLAAWTHGGEVFVLNQTQGNALISTCAVSTATGVFSCTYGTDGLSVGGVSGSAPSTGDIIKVIIDYSCPVSSSNCTGTYTPPANTEYTYTELAFLSGAADIGYLKTGTGPNAVTLADINTKSPNVWLPVTLAAVTLVGVGGVALLLRRRRVA